MLSKREHRKIFVQTRYESIKTESIPSVSRSLVEASVCLSKAWQKDKFFCGLGFFQDLR